MMKFDFGIFGGGLDESYVEWLEDTLQTNRSVIVDDTITVPESEMTFDVDDGGKFRVGDQVQVEGSGELMFVTGISGNSVSVERGYSGTSAEGIANGDVLNILGNASLEGGDKGDVRFTNRVRKGNYTQILSAAVEVSGSDMAANQLGLANEMDYQKQERLRELIRDLENIVINGGQSLVSAQGGEGARRTMNGIVKQISSNAYKVGDAGVPDGDVLDEEKINFVLRNIWENSNAGVDTIVVNGYQKRQINSLLDGSRFYGTEDRKYSSLVSYYESDFGLCRVVLSRWVPRDMVLFLDSSRVSVLPMAGRSFHFKPLASTGDYECGQLIGEYTLEFKNEQAHGYLRGLKVS